MNGLGVDWLLWLDFETTGLEVESCGVLEVAATLTRADDPSFTPVWAVRSLTVPFTDLPPRLTHRDTERVAAEMSYGASKMHMESGLWGDWRDAALDRRVATVAEVMTEVYEQMRVLSDGRDTLAALAGSGVAAFDRPILDRLVPWFSSSSLVYWSLDMGPVRRLARLSGHPLPGPVEPAHRAGDDVAAALEMARAASARLKMVVDQ